MSILTPLPAQPAPKTTDQHVPLVIQTGLVGCPNNDVVVVGVRRHPLSLDLFICLHGIQNNVDLFLLVWRSMLLPFRERALLCQMLWWQLMAPRIAVQGISVSTNFTKSYRKDFLFSGLATICRMPAIVAMPTPTAWATSSLNSLQV